jgi:hypothetical protein
VSATSEGEYAKTEPSLASLVTTDLGGADLYPGGAATPKAKVESTEASTFDHIKTLSAAVEAVTNSGILTEAEAGTRLCRRAPRGRIK